MQSVFWGDDFKPRDFMLRNNTLKKQNSLDVQQQKWLSQDFTFSLYTKLFVLSTESND